MSKNIYVKETYEWIKVGNGENELTETEYEKLLKYLDNNNDVLKSNIIDIRYKKLRFINYVGVIYFENVILEILPKLSLSNDIVKDREMLLQMLSTCNKIPIIINENIKSSLKNYNLMNFFVMYFIESMQMQIKRGIYFEYINKIDNSNVVKGKILISKYAREKNISPMKIKCEYDEYSENNFLNQVLKKACISILCRVNDNLIQNKIKKILSYFYNVDLVYINREELLDYKFYKNNDRFKDCYSLAKLILLNLSMDNSENNQDAFSILFEINILYEEYIGNLIKNIWNNEFRETYIQDKSKFLLKNEQTGKKTFNLRPDIVLYDSKYESEIIIDTKWKAIEVDSNIFYRSSDIYQMYAYITSYENAKRCILLYPCIKKDKNYSSWRLLESFKGKFIEAKTVRLDNIKNTISDLKKIIFNYKF
ncbi:MULTISPECIES: McrC family protein [unclassified Clostridioides]|uniref:McrC family protein n=1 Tax=unclassified Clostridioides TaxID=2635829 RepID=UPI001D12E783|nr:hypothetical protein [Clostridioides sp. ES-S-0001-02]MCC0638744.1 hypothetical protein [Clostridioides sp. ES-S-0049-03]MCC0655092.1 hypothetical protein [Clostridioides sp. ES-S-0123-01]MCC0673484.1 hypothetical protein [Clostridioides sp. ES-S-0145-01]MCC0675132.1 hypothetical protein [Clostridioides sp. ES-W-0018-02]MCC0708938.1 hypothetical protein [Clostridioides sp. ES-S-0190-01]MCC0710057.1 hypothetical protein [Clostridioides sp. ES-W-0017-02]